MTQNLHQYLIDLGDRRLRADVVPEFSLYHRVGGLRIAPLVIGLQEITPVEVVVVPEAVPQPIEFLPDAVRPLLEGYIRGGSHSINGMEVPSAGVGLIRTDFTDSEIAGSGVYQAGQLRLNKHRNTIARWIRDGKLPATQLGNVVWIRKGDVERSGGVIEMRLLEQEDDFWNSKH